MKKFIKKFLSIFFMMGILICSAALGNTVQAKTAQPVSYITITGYCDATGKPIYNKNQIGEIDQSRFPLLIATYQKGYGQITHVYVDNKDLHKVYTQSDFYQRGNTEPVFYVPETDYAETDSDGDIISWYNYISVSTLSKGNHTITVVSEFINGPLGPYGEAFDSIKINVV